MLEYFSFEAVYIEGGLEFLSFFLCGGWGTRRGVGDEERGGRKE